MRDKIYSLIAWILLIPFIPYYIGKGVYLAIKGCELGMTRDEIIKKYHLDD